MIIRPYKWQDAIDLLKDPNEKGLKGYKDGEKWAKLNESEGPGYTAIDEGKIIGCGGIRIFWDGVGEAWSLYPRDIGQKHLDPQIAKKKLYEMIEENNLKRIQVTPRCDWPEGLRYVRYMGFKIEGKLEKYRLSGDNGKLADCFMAVIIKE